MPRGDGLLRLQLRLLLLRVLLLSAKEYVAKLQLRYLLRPRFPMWLLLHRCSPKGKRGLRPLLPQLLHRRHLQ